MFTDIEMAAIILAAIAGSFLVPLLIIHWREATEWTIATCKLHLNVAQAKPPRQLPHLG